MKKVILMSAFCFSVAASGQTCFQLSKDGTAFAKTPELLCMEEVGDAKDSFTLETGLFAREVHVSYQLDLISQAECLACRVSSYAIRNPSNSTYSESAQISFNGKVNIWDGAKESGTVTVAGKKYFYRSF